MRLALEHPKSVARLVLMGPGGLSLNLFHVDPTEGVQRLMDFGADPTREKLRAFISTMVVNQELVTDELVDVRHTIYHRPSFVENIDHLLCLQEMENRSVDLLTAEQLGRIKAPTRVVWGAENPFGDVPEARAMSEAITGSELAIYPECGHWPQHEHADRFNKETLAFLAAHA
jgi:2-hydroxy-6-oxonona-2,4-dienedioate hydrolase